MRIILDIPDDIFDDVDEEILNHSNEVCGLGPLPASGYWAQFQGLWTEAVEIRKRSEDRGGKATELMNFIWDHDLLDEYRDRLIRWGLMIDCTK